MDGYEFQEYEDQMEKLKKVTSEVIRFKKGDEPLTSEHIEKKLGNKSEMAGLIARLTNVCFESMKTLRILHKHNFDLRGKVVELSSAALDGIKSDFRNSQDEVKKEIAELKGQMVLSTEEGNKTYAGVLGDSHSLVRPLRIAMEQVKTKESRMRNVVVHGLDIDPSTPEEGLVEHVKQMACLTVNDCDGEGLYDFPEEVTVLGEINKSGRAPPVLVRMKDESEAKLVLSRAHKLSKMCELRRVYITPDMDKKEREKRRELKDLLKKRIGDFPERHWVIRRGDVTSIGKHKQSTSDESKLSKLNDNSSDRSFKYKDKKLEARLKESGFKLL